MSQYVPDRPGPDRSLRRWTDRLLTVVGWVVVALAVLTVVSAGAAATSAYRVEELIGVWTELARIADDGSAYYRWSSDALDDGSTHTYRVTPVGTNGNDGTPLTFVVLCVRYPDPPAFTLEYDQGAAEVTFDLA